MKNIITEFLKVYSPTKPSIQTPHRWIRHQREVAYNVSVTPVDAKHLLDEWNYRNRPISPRKVKQYFSDMAADRWKEEDSDFVRLGKDGVVQDGQKRLIAAYLSGRTIRFNLELGRNPEAVQFIDSNEGRNSTINPSILDAIRNGDASSKDTFSARSKGHPIARIMMIAEGMTPQSPAHLEEFYQSHNESIHYVIENCLTKPLYCNAVLAAIASFYERNQPEAITFLAQYSGDGANLSSKSPSLRLRNYVLLADRAYGTTAQVKDYRRAVWCIHRFHEGGEVANLCTKDSWDF